MGVFFALLLSVSAQQQYGYDQGEIWNWKKYFDQLRLIRTFVRSGRLRVNSIILLVIRYNLSPTNLKWIFLIRIKYQTQVNMVWLI